MEGMMKTWTLEEWYNSLALEITLTDDQNFLKIKETLTRIGISSSSQDQLFQSCHIFHKRNKYYIVHFKELFALDGKEVNINESDIQRRNRIASLLSEWNMIEIVNCVDLELAPMSKIKVIPYRDKERWELVSKYNIGGTR